MAFIFKCQICDNISKLSFKVFLNKPMKHTLQICCFNCHYDKREKILETAMRDQDLHKIITFAWKFNWLLVRHWQLVNLTNY